MDQNEGIEVAEMEWFWPQRKVATDDDDDEEEKETKADESDDEDAEAIEYDTAEKLNMLTNYMRTTYCYCHWCGTHYTDVTDLTDNCPGQTKDEH